MPTLPVRILIVAFWAGMMGWLVQREILPRVVLGSPPGYRSVVAPADEQTDPVDWAVFVGEEHIGNARTERHVRGDGRHVLSSSVRLNRLPVLRGLEESLGGPVGLHAKTHFVIDETGNLAYLRIVIRLDDLDEPLIVQGKVEADALEVSLQLGQFRQENRLPYDRRSLVLDAFSPLERLPDLRIGQAWNVPLVNPLTRRVELLRAEVVRREIITWDGQPVGAYVVRQKGPASLEARCWVREDGTVLRQEVPLWWSTMRFEREPARK